jgi:hypothetical protein
LCNNNSDHNNVIISRKQGAGFIILFCENGEIKKGYIHRHVACTREIRNLLVGKLQCGWEGFKGAECEDPAVFV